MSVRLYVAPGDLCPGLLQISGDEHHYLSKVRRQKVGNEVVLFDGQGRQARARIQNIDASSSELDVGPCAESPPPSFDLCIATALIKGNRMETAITKMVELGVSRIQPLTSERTIVRLKAERAESRGRRFDALALAAMRQCRREHRPLIEPITSLEDFLNAPAPSALKLLTHTGDNTSPLSSVLPREPQRSATVLVGPEGGFSRQEMEAAAVSGYRAVSLGPRILRAETACITIAALLQARYGDIGTV